MNRRHVLQALLVGAAFTDSAAAAQIQGLKTLPNCVVSPNWRIVIFDSRFAPARSFGASLLSAHPVSRAITGDVTSLWHQMLNGNWHRNSTEVVGMTTAASFFCLEQLAADRFWRTTSRLEHKDLVKWAMAPRKGARS